MAGKSVDEIVAYGEEIYDELMERRIWSGTRALAQQHLDAGQRVWLVTATPVELARIIAERLGLTGALGTVTEVEDGLYTGRLVGEPLHGPAKAEAVRALAEREGLDLSPLHRLQRLAQRLPMLSAVGHAVRRSTPTGAARAGPRAAAGRSATSAPGARPPRSACPPRPAPGALAGGVVAGPSPLHRPPRPTPPAPPRRARTALTLDRRSAGARRRRCGAA